MADENVSALFVWGRSLVQTAASAGMPMQAVPESSDIKDFSGWAKTVADGMGGMMPLPPISAESDYAAALAWAKALDTAARGMGAALPPLP